MRIKGGALLLALLIILMGTTTVFAAQEQASSALLDTAAYIHKTAKNPQVDSVGGEWAIIGLARSGYDVLDSYYEDYYRAVEVYVKAADGLLHDKKITEYSRVILALTAAVKRYEVAEMLFLMLFKHPACLGISLLCAFCDSIYLNDQKALRSNVKYMLPMLVVTALINSAFNHEGSTILAYLRAGNPLTPESIIYGIAVAVMLSAVISGFSAISRCIYFIGGYAGRPLPALLSCPEGCGPGSLSP